jgi:tetratricopeptide (TPR) repeat protein
LKKALKNEPSDWAIWIKIVDLADDLTDLAEQRTDCEQALICLNKWIPQHPDDLQASIELSHALVSLDRVDEALANAKALVKRYPTQASAWDALGKCYQAKYSFDEWRKMLEKAIRLFPDNPDFHRDYAAAIIYEQNEMIFGIKSFDVDRLLAFKQEQAFNHSSLGKYAEQTKPEDKEKKADTTNKREQPPAWGSLSYSAKPEAPKRSDGSNGVVNQSASPFRKAQEEAELAVKLYRQRDPSNLWVIVALWFFHAAEGCDQPLTSTVKSGLDCTGQVDVANELTRLIQIFPDNLALQCSLFQAKYLIVWQKLVNEKKISNSGVPGVSLKTVLKKEEWQEFESFLQLENQIKDLTPENAIFAHYVLSGWALGLGENQFAIDHARQLCDLAPEFSGNWQLLAATLGVSKKWADILSIKDKWLKHDPSAETHFLLAKAAEGIGDWTLVRYHVAESLKIDPKNVKLLYSQVIADLKNASSPAELKAAHDHLLGTIEAVKKDEKWFEKVGDEDVCPVLIVCPAVNGELANAQKELEYALHYYPQNPDFMKLRQLLGVAGLQPPTLGKP